MHSCCVGDADEAFDDDELLELAQAGRSQNDQGAPQLWPQQQALTKDTAVLSSKNYHVTTDTPCFVPGNKLAEEQISTGQPMASHQQALPGSKPGPGPGPSASVAEDAHLELDDDELIELACASLDPQQDGAAATSEQPLPQLTKWPVSDTQAPSASTGKAAIGESPHLLSIAICPTFCTLPLSCRLHCCLVALFSLALRTLDVKTACCPIITFAANDSLSMFVHTWTQNIALHALQVQPQITKQLAVAQQTPTQSTAWMMMSCWHWQQRSWLKHPDDAIWICMLYSIYLPDQGTKLRMCCNKKHSA